MSKLSGGTHESAKSIVGLDLTKGTEELLNYLAALKVPGVNMDALVANQRDNLEALGVANRAAMEGIKAAAQWQMKVLHETMEELKAAIDGLAKDGSPQDMLVTEADLAKKAFETALSEMRELAEIVTNANKQATEAIVKRIPESLEEIKDVLKIVPYPRGS